MNRAERIRRLRVAIDAKRRELDLTERNAPPELKNLVELLRRQATSSPKSPHRRRRPGRG